VAGVADVDVEQPVAIHVGERYARDPRARALEPDAGFLGDVAEPERAEIQIEAWPALIRRENDLRQTVAREIARRHSAAVVEVPVPEDVEVARLGEPVL